VRHTTRNVIGMLIVSALLLALAPILHGQETSLTGTVTDATDAVLPGVTVTALHVESGNTFVGVTDASGVYRIGALRTGIYTINAGLSGFSPVTRENVQVQVGQRAVLNFRMTVSAVETSVTVTGQTPLVDVSQSKLGGNIDTRQMQELPINGRNWMQLTLLAPGSRANAVVDAPVTLGFAGGDSRFQLNVDGQEVTSTIAGSSQGEPRFSREAMAEFELISNRFDATQGRSIGVQVNVITKSGTNLYSGTSSGYFRDDRFIAKDFIVHRVLPYSDQQVAETFGGPIIKDKTQFFGYYEYERQPQSFTFTSPFPSFNIPDLHQTYREKKAGLRLDEQFSAGSHLAVRGSLFSSEGNLAAGGATNHPSNASITNRYNTVLFANLSTTLGAHTLNEVKAGYTWVGGPTYGLVEASGSSLCCSIKSAELINVVPNIPLITLRGYTIGKRNDAPYDNNELKYSLRDDLSYVFTRAGHHEVRTGAEYIFDKNYLHWYQNRDGEIDATGGPIPANIQDLFPVWNDPSTWNIAALSPIVIRYKQSFGTYDVNVPQNIWAAWIQDNWAIRRLTLNLGVRYDLNSGIFANRVAVPPFLSANRPSDRDDFGPRLGFAFALNPRTVIRGGSGKFYGWISDYFAHNTVANSNFAIPETPNDGRLDFASNPYNGNPPSYQQALLMRRDLLRSIQSSNMEMPNAWTTSIGVQRQVGETTSVQADYVHTASRNEIGSRNTNLTYNPVTGAPNPFTDLSTRPYPNWGLVALNFTDGWSNYNGLETALTRRLSNRWQASATYTLSVLRDATGTATLPANVVPDLGGEYTPAVGDQRHRAVFNGIWQLPLNLQMSGLYFFGSGQRFSTNYGGDLRNTGGTSGGRLRPDGTIVPRNNFVGLPIHRVDIRLERRFAISGRSRVDGILEVFNLFNHENFGSYVTAESNRNYGLPVQNTNVAYQPRLMQLGFRFAF
jgi:hypothetical protein